MKKQFLWTFLILFLCGAVPGYAQEQGSEDTGSFDDRENRTFNVQFVTLGGRPPAGVSGGHAGIHLGFQLSKMIYLGGTVTRFYDSPFGNKDWKDEGWHEEPLGQEDGRLLDSEVGSRNSIEVRIMPFDFGFYFSAGILQQGKDEAHLRFATKDRAVGDNSYNTGLEAKVKYEARTIPMMGIGFQHVFFNGIVLGVGAQVGLSKLQEPDVTVTATNSDVTQENMDIWKSQIEKNEKRLPGQGYLSVGYAF